LANVKSDQHAQLRSVAAGIDPVLVEEVVEELQGVRGLREHADDLRTVLRHGDPEDQRKSSGERSAR